MENKVIITVAPTGNVPTKEMNPNLPVTPQEIADQIYECWEEGAAVAHIHARDREGKPTSDVNVYREILACLEAKRNCDIITQLSTGGRAGKSYQERGQMICLAPEMASLATGSSNFPTSANFNDPETIAYLAGEMKKYGVKPEIEVFDTAMLFNALQLVKKGVLEWPLQINLVLGVPGSQPASAKQLFFLYENLPEGVTWTVSAIGKDHVSLSAVALALGGSVRVGLEDNIYYRKGVLATNVDLVRRVKKIALAMGREIATPAEARQILGLKKRQH
ncbi:MAG: 3-keto-5-aminohexanoate cleavage protein [Peptococcaceae bacterium]|jgi:3-keto-5-aminohexanoate cleavage enzyme|nr:3-keto-5-aminohexanoate cleavage protein [Peptococcaceae bacterium]MDH7525612.1 3-keto-5-aminohexanoate cleavage protein [Peptococcaceae bacterium]